MINTFVYIAGDLYKNVHKKEMRLLLCPDNRVLGQSEEGDAGILNVFDLLFVRE